MTDSEPTLAPGASYDSPSTDRKEATLALLFVFLLALCAFAFQQLALTQNELGTTRALLGNANELGQTKTELLEQLNHAQFPIKHCSPVQDFDAEMCINTNATGDKQVQWDLVHVSIQYHPELANTTTPTPEPQFANA